MRHGRVRTVERASAECTESVEAHNRRFFDRLKLRPSPIRAGVTVGQSLSGRPSRHHRTTHRSTKSQVFQRTLPASSSSSPQHGAQPRCAYHPGQGLATSLATSPPVDVVIQTAVVPIGTGPQRPLTATDRVQEWDCDQMIAFRLGGAGVSPSTTNGRGISRHWSPVHSGYCSLRPCPDRISGMESTPQPLQRVLCPCVAIEWGVGVRRHR